MLEQDLRRVVLAGSNYALERDLKKQSCLKTFKLNEFKNKLKIILYAH